MKDEKLKDYPMNSSDPFMDFEFMRQCNRRGVIPGPINELEMSSGHRVVYSLESREGNEWAETPLGPRRILEKYINVYGYLVSPRGFLKYLKGKKVKSIPEKEREKIKSTLVKKLEEDKIINLKEIVFIN